MNDRELLELAAKAAGIEVEYDNGNMVEVFGSEKYPEAIYWNPLTDDGDALRLAVKLEIYAMVVPEQNQVSAVIRNGPRCFWLEKINDDPYAATRRAIVRAAAAIGEQMK